MCKGKWICNPWSKDKAAHSNQLLGTLDIRISERKNIKNTASIMNILKDLNMAKIHEELENMKNMKTREIKM